MKKKDTIIYTILLCACMLITINVVTEALLNRSLLKLPNIWSAKPATTVAQDFQCSNQPANTKLDNSSNNYLAKLAEYQSICHSFVTDRLMVFTSMPKDDLSAKNMATALAKTIKEFNAAGVKPIMIVEPTTDWGEIDFAEFADGFYDKWTATYFKTLKAQGVSDQMIGMWVPFPEANLPYWNRSTSKPTDFPKIINKYFGIARASFPALPSGVLLNSASYDSKDFDWAEGEYSSLVPWTKGMDKKLVDSFGLQGFPWLPPANRAGPGIIDASEFLNYKLAQEAADAIGVKKVWFNTGTFATKYAGESAKQAGFGAEQRTDILNGVVAQAQKLQTAGYSISINLFAEDKSNTNEATDWSYFNSTNASTSTSSPVFTNFASRLHQAEIPLSIYDTRN